MTKHAGMRIAVVAWVVLVANCRARVLSAGPSIEHGTIVQAPERTHAELPYYMMGASQRQFHHYAEDVEPMPHTAFGEGLSLASTENVASFTIQLNGENGTALDAEMSKEWNMNGARFMYVWIVSDDQMLIAEVVNNFDGTLTAAYKSDFPGEYLIYVEDVRVSGKNLDGTPVDNNRPISGSPFALTVSGPVTIDIDNLPVCSAIDNDDVTSTFWRKGTWLSSNVVNAKRGVLSNGWVFQPKDCFHETFSYDDLMVLAALEKPTWLLVLGGSVQRGLFLSLIDQALRRGQKDEMAGSAVRKCWGWSDVRIGNLRVSYQDMRLWTMHSTSDVVVCNNEKLASDSTEEYVLSATHFLRNNIFKEGEAWPDLIVTAANLVARLDSENLAIEVPMDTLPPEWEGKIVFVEHMAAFNFYWKWENPTVQELSDINYNYRGPFEMDKTIRQIEQYREQDPRVTFMSMFPMNQAILWENAMDIKGQLCYGCNQHFHYVSKPDIWTAYNGEKVVHSTLMEMLSNIMLSQAVGTRAELYERARDVPDIGHKVSEVRTQFEVCSDCPANLVPFHVKTNPTPVCETVVALPPDHGQHAVWNNELCPAWCIATDPVAQTPTNAGPVDVRECAVRSRQP